MMNFETKYFVKFDFSDNQIGQYLNREHSQRIDTLKTRMVIGVGTNI